MDVMCEVFEGRNTRKHVYIWTGEGDNGKSVTTQLFQKMLGALCAKPPTSLLTGKRTQASSASPELAKLGNGARWAVFDEPEKMDTINCGILKQLSGNDTYYARKLYSDGIEIVPMFKMCLIANVPPPLPYDDKAVWNRIRVIPFESVFLSYNDMNNPAYEKYPYKFCKDDNIHDQLQEMAEAFAWLLLNHKATKSPNLYEPPKVKIATENYRTRSDSYRQFVSEEIETSEEDVVSVRDLYEAFKEWHRRSYPGHSIPIRIDMEDYFNKIWTRRGIVYTEHRLKTAQDIDMVEF